MNRVLVSLAATALCAAGVALGGAPANAASTTSSYCDQQINHSGGDFATAPFQNKAGWCLTQALAKYSGGYSGPIDGEMGTNSWIGIQNWAAGYGYSGPKDGVPGPNTYKAMQRYLNSSGAGVAVDGSMSSSDWKTWNTNLKYRFVN